MRGCLCLLPVSKPAVAMLLGLLFLFFSFFSVCSFFSFFCFLLLLFFLVVWQFVRGWMVQVFLRLTVSPQSSHESRISVCKFTNYILKIQLLYSTSTYSTNIGTDTAQWDAFFGSYNSTTAADRLLNSEL